MSRCFVSRGRRGTWWHSDVFCNVSKVVLCGKRNTFATFSDDALQFSWQAQNFGRVHRHFAWQAQHFRACCLRIALAGLRQVATRCRFRGTRGILWDVLKINGSLAQNSDFEVANLEVPKKTRRKTSILRLQSVKIGGSLARNARFDASTCLVSSLWFSCGLAVSMGEAAQAFLFDFFSTVKIGRSLARNARFSAPTCLVSSLWFCGFAVSMGEAAKPLLFGGFQAGCSVVLRGRRGTLWHSNLFDNVSKDVESVKIGGSLARNARFAAPTCLVSSLWFSCGLAVSMGEVTKSLLFKGFQAGRHFVLRGRRGTLWHSNLFYTVSKVLCVAGATKQYTRHFTLYTLHSTLYTLHFTLHTPHSSLYIPHSALYTLHFPLHTPHSTLYPPHFTLHNLHFRLLTPHSTLYTPRSTLYTPHSTLYTLHFTLHTPHSTLPTPYSPLYTLHSTLHTPQFTLHTRRQSGSKCQGSLVNMSLAR